MKFVAQDGKIFADQKECEQYEKEIQERYTEQDREYKDLMDKRKAVESAQREYYEALDRYNTKYKDKPCQTFSDLLNWMFS